MNETLSTYFAGEKNGGLVLIGMGVVSLIACIAFFPAKLELRSFAITVGAWSLLELTVGIGLFLKTDAQVGALQTQLTTDKAAMIAAETPRMETVQRNFVFIQYVWLTFIVLGAFLGWFFKESNATLAGVALGFLLNAAMFLPFEISADRRGAVYLAALKSPPAQ